MKAWEVIVVELLREEADVLLDEINTLSENLGDLPLTHPFISDLREAILQAKGE